VEFVVPDRADRPLADLIDCREVAVDRVTAGDIVVHRAASTRRLGVDVVEVVPRRHPVAAQIRDRDRGLEGPVVRVRRAGRVGAVRRREREGRRNEPAAAQVPGQVDRLDEGVGVDEAAAPDRSCATATTTAVTVAGAASHPAQARRAREALVVGRRTAANAASSRQSPPSEGRSGAASQARHGAAFGGRNSAGFGLLFGEAVEEFIVHRARMKSWKGGVSGAEADSYRRTFTRTSLAQVPINSITTVDIAAVLTSMPAATAEKTRTRVVCVLNWARAMGYRESTENIARRRGLMEYLLNTVPKTKHHSALPWAEVPVLMRELQMLDSSPARALEWTILTAARAAETLGTTRSEIKSASEFARIAGLTIDLVQGDTWVIPAERMKEGKEHYVPLPQAVLRLIAGRNGKLFPGHERQMFDLLNKLRPGYTVHGFRSSFADWAAEHDYPQELREMALSHSVGNAVEQAYRRSTRVKSRREMMSAWSDFALEHCAFQ
jgi:integrase